MLHANLLARVRVRPLRNISGGVDARSTRLEVLIHDYTLVDAKTGLARELESRPHPDASHDDIGRQGRAVIEVDTLLVDPDTPVDR